MYKQLKSIIIFLVIFTLCFAAAIPVSAADNITYTDQNNFKYDSIYFQAALTNTVQNIIKFDNTIISDNNQRVMNDGLILKINNDVKFNALFRSIGLSPSNRNFDQYNFGKGYIFYIPVAIPANKKVDFDFLIMSATFGSDVTLSPISTATVSVKVIYDDDTENLLVNGSDFFLTDALNVAITSVTDNYYGRNYPSKRITFNYTDSKNIKNIELKVFNDTDTIDSKYAFADCTLAWTYPLGSTGVDDPSQSPDGEVIGSIENIGNQITDLNQSITDVENKVDEVKDSIENLSKPDPENQDQINDLEDKQDELKQQFDDFNNVMDSVEKPDTQTVITKPGNIMGGNQGSAGIGQGSTIIIDRDTGKAPKGDFEYNPDLVAAMFGDILQNDFIKWMLVSTASLALISYVLFGKRGA